MKGTKETWKNFRESITKEEKELVEKHWAEVYIHTDSRTTDIHSLFAEKVGVDRQRAKQLAYLYTYQNRGSHFFGTMLRSNQVRGKLVVRIQKLHKFIGNEYTSIYQILEQAEKEVEEMERKRKENKDKNNG